MNKIVKEYFDKVAPNYVSDSSTLVIDLLDSLDLKNCHRILDLGCGKGVISEELFNRSSGEITAIDLSSKMIELAKEKINNPKIHFINADFYQYFDDKFDAIICFDAYPHFFDVEAFINKSDELLNENGLLAIIHNIGRSTLNEHHKRNAGKVSRLLKNPEEEVIPFLNKFTPIELFEDDDCYKIILKKN